MCVVLIWYVLFSNSYIQPTVNLMQTDCMLFVRKFGVWWHHHRRTKIDLKGIECRIGNSSGNYREKLQITIVVTAVRRAGTCCAVIDVQLHFICNASELTAVFSVSSDCRNAITLDCVYNQFVLFCRCFSQLWF